MELTRLHRGRAARVASLQALLLAALVLPLAPAILSAQARPAAAPKATRVTSVEGITEYTLPNGLEVLLFPDQSKPTVTVNITYLVGSRHEGYGETGMAHLLEHLVFKGTPKRPSIPKELDAHGARFNGTTWYDRTNYFETMPATEANLRWALEMEADRMVNSFIAKKDLESEFSVVRNEFEIGENNPQRILLQRLMSAAYEWHGYGRSTIGSRSDIEGVPIDRLQAFYRKYYQPDNAVLVVAGKFEPQATLALIEQTFGKLARPERSLAKGNLIHQTYTTEPTQDGERFVAVRRTGDAPLVGMAYHVPAGSHPDFAAIEVLTQVLGNNPSGRLYKALVEPKLAASTGSFAFQLREPGVLLAQSQLRTGGPIDSVRAVMAATLDAAATSPVTADEVQRAKTAILKNVELQLNNSEEIGYELTEWAAQGDWRLFFLHRDRVEKVTAADVQRVAAAYLKPSNRTVGIFYPTDKPDRAEIPTVPSIAAMVADYKGRAVVQAGEAFDASPKNIESRLTRATLASGLQLQLLPKQTRGDRVVATMQLRTGTEQTLMGKQAVADLVADMLSRGTTKLTRQQFKDSLDKLKARVNIGGSPTGTSVRLETVRANLLPTLELVAQALRTPAFDAGEFEKLRQENLAQIEQTRSEPQTLAVLAAQRKAVPRPKGHPHFIPTPAEQVEMYTAATLDEVKAFHRDFYGMHTADVAIVGSFAADSVRAAVQRLFGDWKSVQPYQRVARSFTPTDSSIEVIETPDKANAIFIGIQTLALRDDDPDYPAVTLAGWMLGGGAGLSNRLMNRLRQKEGLSYGAGAQLQVLPLDRSGFLLSYAMFAPQNAERLVAAWREELDKVVTEGFTADEVATAKKSWLQQVAQGRANDDELVSTLVARRFANRTLVYDEKLEAQVEALTVEQINAAAKKHIDPKKTVIVRAGDFAKHPPVKPTP
ncbi:MAG TPA: pitrilysin family protein [Gemmatimonadaceae bacterium]|nr:pitrilysin family protein [Gemmatimonadaceae bacterium]